MFRYSFYNICLASIIDLSHIKYLTSLSEETIPDIVIQWKDSTSLNFEFHEIEWIGMRYGGFSRAYLCDEGILIGINNDYILLKKVEVVVYSNIQNRDKMLECAISFGFTHHMLRKGYISLHGSTIDINGKTIIVLGKSGSGKSTISFFLNKKGYAIINDDISPVTTETDGIYVLHSNSAVIKIDNYLMQDTSAEREENNKEEFYYVINRKTSIKSKLDKIFILNPNPKEETTPSFHILSLEEAVESIMYNLFAYWTVPKPILKDMIKYLAILISDVRIISVNYKKQESCIQKLVDSIEYMSLMRDEANYESNQNNV